MQMQGLVSATGANQARLVGSGARRRSGQTAGEPPCRRCLRIGTDARKRCPPQSALGGWPGPRGVSTANCRSRRAALQPHPLPPRLQRHSCACADRRGSRRASPISRPASRANPDSGFTPMPRTTKSAGSRRPLRSTTTDPAQGSASLGASRLRPDPPSEDRPRVPEVRRAATPPSRDPAVS